MCNEKIWRRRAILRHESSQSSMVTEGAPKVSRPPGALKKSGKGFQHDCARGRGLLVETQVHPSTQRRWWRPMVSLFFNSVHWSASSDQFEMIMSWPISRFPSSCAVWVDGYLCHPSIDHESRVFGQTSSVIMISEQDILFFQQTAFVICTANVLGGIGGGSPTTTCSPTAKFLSRSCIFLFYLYYNWIVWRKQSARFGQVKPKGIVFHQARTSTGHTDQY